MNNFLNNDNKANSTNKGFLANKATKPIAKQTHLAHSHNEKCNCGCGSQHSTSVCNCGCDDSGVCNCNTSNDTCDCGCECNTVPNERSNKKETEKCDDVEDEHHKQTNNKDSNNAKHLSHKENCNCDSSKKDSACTCGCNDIDVCNCNTDTETCNCSDSNINEDCTCDSSKKDSACNCGCNDIDVCNCNTDTATCNCSHSNINENCNCDSSKKDSACTCGCNNIDVCNCKIDTETCNCSHSNINENCNCDSSKKDSACTCGCNDIDVCNCNTDTETCNCSDSNINENCNCDSSKKDSACTCGYNDIAVCNCNTDTATCNCSHSNINKNCNCGGLNNHSKIKVKKNLNSPHLATRAIAVDINNQNKIKASKTVKHISNGDACGCGGSHNHNEKKDSKNAKHTSNDDACGCGHSHMSIDKNNQTKFIIRLAVAFSLVIIFSIFKIKYVSLIMCISAYIIAGFDVILLAVKNIFKGKIFDENFLMTIASLCAILIGDTSEAVALMIFYGIGELLQNYAVSKSKKNITELMNIRPDWANLMQDNQLIKVAPETVNIGDIIVVKVGEKIPLDGIIISGESFINTVALTGESTPKRYRTGDEVLSGTVNTTSVINVKVTKIYSESTVSKILEMVENASAKKATSEKFITRFSKYYTPIVVGIAFLIVIIPTIFGYVNSDILYMAINFLIISCPCALVVSIPMSFFGGIGGSAKNGILVKGGNHLEMLSKIKTIVFDKTGTLTKGVFNVTQVIPSNGVTEQDLITFCAEAEYLSTHPIAKSVLAFYNKPTILNCEITEIAGQGISAKSVNSTILVGNKKLMESIGIVELTDYSETTVYVAKNNIFLGCILIADEIKDNMVSALQEIKNQGVTKLIMLTGDNDKIAKSVADKLGLDSYFANLLPQNKVEKFEEILSHSAKGERVAFVGDGINDSPVLTRADIGIAMGGVGSDSAIESADIVIINDDIKKIATAIKISKKTNLIIKQNIVFSLGTKFLIMALALCGISNIWFSIIADVGVSFLASANALRSIFIKDKSKKR